ncbi:MAG: MBOAT family protein [Magnetococcales bacterium]|nr:MBOAT family protein [Magnetococcales bacterium]
MPFHSTLFVFLFLPVSIVLYYLVHRSRVLSNITLLALSVVFYTWENRLYLAPLAASIGIDFTMARKIDATSDPIARRQWLFISVFTNLAFLSFFKYGMWIADELRGLAILYPNYLAFLGLLPSLNIPLPPGISFYTFHSLSYIVDIYARKTKPHRSFLDYCNFVMFFPLLVAGPIERARNLLTQLSVVRPFPTPREISVALSFIFWGLFKKLVFADNFEVIVVECASLRNSIEVILFGYAFAFQIYCDFSAYSDIARGTARLFGIQLTRNFMTPFFADSPSDFWKRWHISLSSWFRDYVYIPLGGSRLSLLKTVRNLFITMTLCGIWHGSNITFLLWGIFHWLILSVYRIAPLDVWLKRLFGESVGPWIAIVVFFNLNMVGWVLFRSESLAKFSSWASSMASAFSGGFTPAGMDHNLLRLFLFFSLPVLLFELYSYLKNCEFTDLLTDMRPVTKAVLFVAMYFGIVLLGRRAGYGFIYFQF